MNPSKLRLHFISNTHWDREWRYSMQRTRHMLVQMLDMLFDILDQEPEFKSFHMDSQSIPLTDYLEIRPEMEAKVRKYIKEGRFFVGPWFVLPDEYCVGGESLVRNLLLGHKIAGEYGGVSKTGYSPFGWGQISQMPQLYRGFGIDMISFYRGVNAGQSEFIWEGPDGTRIFGSRLGRRPRYNVWYILQRPAYWGETDVDNRYMDWNAGNGQFKFISGDLEANDYQYLHPRFGYDPDMIPAYTEQAVAEQDKDWSQPNRFWSAGHDTSTPDLREVKMIRDIRKALGDRGEVFHSTVKDWQEAVKAHANPSWPVLTGEMRHPAAIGSSSELIGWAISSRMPIKQANFKTERDITAYAEPLAVFASFIGAPYPASFIDLAYNYLLQNHGHDSIAGCGRDVLEFDVMNRFRQSREIAGCVTERAMMDIVGAIDFKPLRCEAAIVAYNPAPFARTEVVDAVLQIPRVWKCKAFEIRDENGVKCPVQIIRHKPDTRILAQNPNDVANFQLTDQYAARVEIPDVPGMGYRAFKVVPLDSPKQESPKTMLSGPRTMENEYIAAEIHADGTYTVTDKATGRAYAGLGFYRDSSETGTPWTRVPVQEDEIYTTLGCPARVTLLRDGALEAAFRIQLDWTLPARAGKDGAHRSTEMRAYPIETILTLRKGQPWLDVVTNLDNTVEDHYLQVAFPTGIQASGIDVQSHFDVISRPVAKPDYSQYREPPMTEHPMNSFVDISDGSHGFALLNEGLKAYEADGDARRTVYLSLLRCYPLHMYITEFDVSDYSETDRHSQCPGKHSFHYAVAPHAGDWQTAGLWQLADRFNLHLQAALTAPTEIGALPLRHSFIEFSAPGLILTGVKQSEDGEGYVLRLFNPSDKTVEAAVRINGGKRPPEPARSPVERLRSRYTMPAPSGKPWAVAQEVTLEELPVGDLRPAPDGWIPLSVGRKKIFTLKVR